MQQNLKKPQTLRNIRMIPSTCCAFHNKRCGKPFSCWSYSSSLIIYLLALLLSVSFGSALFRVTIQILSKNSLGVPGLSKKIRTFIAMNRDSTRNFKKKKIRIPERKIQKKQKKSGQQLKIRIVPHKSNQIDSPFKLGHLIVIAVQAKNSLKDCKLKKNQKFFG